MDTEYKAWKADPSSSNLQTLMGSAKSNIDMALKTYVGNEDKAARSHAKILAVKAFRSFDPTKGTQLRTHFLTQLQPLRRMAAKRRTVMHVPEVVQQDMAGLNTATSELVDTLDRQPADSELADYTGLSIRRIQDMRRRNMAIAESSRQTIDGEDFQDVVDTPGALNTWAEYVYYDLSAVDRKIYEWRTGFGGRKKLTNNMIARKLKLTPGAVSQRADRIAKRIEEGLQYAD